jgi:hypothetical protein
MVDVMRSTDFDEATVSPALLIEVMDDSEEDEESRYERLGWSGDAVGAGFPDVVLEETTASLVCWTSCGRWFVTTGKVSL